MTLENPYPDIKELSFKPGDMADLVEHFRKEVLGTMKQMGPIFNEKETLKLVGVKFIFLSKEGGDLMKIGLSPNNFDAEEYDEKMMKDPDCGIHLTTEDEDY